jgi:DNA replication protein DnaC
VPPFPRFTPDQLLTGPVVEPGEAEYLLRTNAARLNAEVGDGTPPRYARTVQMLPEVLAWTRDVCNEARMTAAGPALVEGPSLLTAGPTGTGKTHQAWEALRRLANSGATFRWRAFAAPDLYARLRPQAGVNSEAEYQAAATADVLLLDDLGAAKGSEWVEEVNYRLISHRYDHHKPTIMTTNLPPNRLRDYLGDRSASRLAEMCTVLPVVGEDRRRSS